ncbi:MAG: polysaccharide lyase 6 family protein [Flavobacterium sp.]|nr:polysaccharide lyase 6 family protein [Flavobacterium sp.]
MKYLIILILLPITVITKAAQFTVSSPSNLKAALAKAIAGDAIIWKNGTYNDVVVNFCTTVNGTTNQPIILKAETAGKVVFTGSSQLIVNGNYLQAEGFLFEGTSTLLKGDVLTFAEAANYCRITNCAVINYTPTNVMVNNNWINLQGTYNQLDHCYFKGKTNQGPYLVVRYKKDAGYVDGSNTAPSSYHHIHHNYFGYRTLPTDNGGEDMRIGDSFTSFTNGFNIIEYNYFEDHRLEAEVISNKSWNNIYRFNTFVNNDGQMVLRHGQQCFVYGNYFDGKTGRGTSGGIRIINANQTVFNNYITNIEASAKDVSKSGIVVMCGLLGSPLNGYYPADNALIAFNTIVNAAMPAIKFGYGNKTKGLPLVAPNHLTVVSNLIVDAVTNGKEIAEQLEPVTYAACSDNAYTNGATSLKGFEPIKRKSIEENAGFLYRTQEPNTAIIDSINKRLAIHNIHLSPQEIMHFNPAWKLTKSSVGVTWIH